MSRRKFNLARSGQVEVCPKCSNDITFVAHSAQVSEDCCETWVECKCGFDPTREKLGSRFEDIWGGCDKDTITMALDVWNDLVVQPCT